jgi:cytochrome c oxidase subunit II
MQASWVNRIRALKMARRLPQRFGSGRRPPTRSRQCLLATACCLILSGCDGVQSSLDPAGPQAAQISRLWWIIFYTLTAVFLIVISFLLAAVVRRPVPETGDGEQPTVKDDPRLERRMGKIVTGGIVITILILFAFLIGSFLLGRSLNSLASTSTDPLTIDVTGQQWWWQVKYENSMASQIVTTANEIHIPVGRVVQLKLRSNDVIHSFWVPNLHGKTDLIPGHIAATWLRADRPGVWRGQCAEFCGHQHAHMALIVVAETEEQFKNWYDNQLKSAIPPATDRQVRGQQVFMSSPCVTCHRIQGTDAGGAVGPDLTHIGSRSTIAAATLENNREQLSKWVLDSQTIKPGNRMPPNPLSTDDLAAVVEYLQTLK